MGILKKAYQTYRCPKCNCELSILTDDKFESFGICEKKDSEKKLKEWKYHG